LVLSLLLAIVAIVISRQPVDLSEKADQSFVNGLVRVMTQNEVYADSVYAAIDKKVEVVSAKIDTVELKADSALAEIAKTRETQKQLANVVYTHGRKTNDLAELIFKIAFGSQWKVKGKAAFAQYAKCGNQALFDSTVTKLNEAQCAKLKKIADIDVRIAEIQKELSAKPAPTPTEVKIPTDKKVVTVTPASTEKKPATSPIKINKKAK